MNQSASNRPVVVTGFRRNGLAAVIKAAVVAFAVAAALLAGLGSARAYGDDDYPDSGPGFKLGKDSKPNDPAPPPPPDNPAPPPDNGGDATKPDDGGNDGATYMVQIMVPNWSVHSHGYADEYAAKDEALSLQYRPLFKVEPDEVNGGYALWVQVPYWTDYQRFDNAEDAEDFKAALLKKHNSGRLKVRVTEVRTGGGFGGGYDDDGGDGGAGDGD
jgi:hypothetical protein